MSLLILIEVVRYYFHLLIYSATMTATHFPLKFTRTRNKLFPICNPFIWKNKYCIINFFETNSKKFPREAIVCHFLFVTLDQGNHVNDIKNIGFSIIIWCRLDWICRHQDNTVGATSERDSENIRDWTWSNGIKRFTYSFYFCRWILSGCRPLQCVSITEQNIQLHWACIAPILRARRHWESKLALTKFEQRQFICLIVIRISGQSPYL